MRLLAVTSVMLALGAAAASGDERCTYGSQFFSPGATSCQGGMQFSCVAGAWQPTGLGCADATGDQEGLQVDPSRRAPAVRDPSVTQPAPPAAPTE